ncbi:amidase signature domain-containing protein [Astrocystis sublimbata]|nr:amidase signature domain-containing protein [Astrocystis sublimbata]
MDTPKQFDLVRMTATELQDLMKNGKLTSVELIKETLAQIHRHNTNGLALKALISTAPADVLIHRATALDRERMKGKLRGPFHGIPVIVKDVINTHHNLGMPTTLGNHGLLSAEVSENATIVDKMIEHGLIIVGKTNLNELSSWKSMGPMNGWSAVCGQTNSAYVKGGLEPNDGVMGHSNPCGASTGSAVGVSAGFSPLALGTEVDGSLVQPAARAALHALKPSVGTTELGGIFAVSEEFDSLGSMAKSTHDLALMTELVLNPPARAKLPKEGYIPYLRKDFTGLRVGFVDPDEWRWPDNVQPQKDNSREQMKQTYLLGMKLVEDHGGKVTFPVTIPPVSEYMIDGASAELYTGRVFKKNLDDYLSAFKSSEIRTAEELIQYNKDHATKELPPDFPEQGRLVDTIDHPITIEEYQSAMTVCRQVSRENGIDKVLSEHDLDLVAFPMDSPCPRVAAAAGYPIATLPMGTLDYNGRPFGLAIIAQQGREELMFSFMSAFEENSEPRAVPPSLVD